MTVPRIPLAASVSIPQLGFGTYQVEPADAERVIGTALELGYRHIDTAQMYGNEREIGAALRGSGVPRGEVFLTSKLRNDMHRSADARRAFDGTLKALAVDYIDLFLIHWPVPTLYDGDFVSTWRTLGEIAAEGGARAVGVSNFQVEHLERVAAETGVAPAVNQVEAHPYFHNGEVRAYADAHGIVTEAWSPIAQGAVLGDPVVTAIAERLERTPAQVVLRWHLQRGHVVFPKSVSPVRMRQNLDVFGFELTEADVRAISVLDRGPAGRIGPDPETFARLPY